MAQSDAPRPGTVLAGKYELDAVLGKGGMGVVFRGKHLGTDRPIALKVLRRELMSDATVAKRFVREAKAAAALQHPNVVDVLDYGVEPDGTAFQVLELLEGESLGEHLARKGSIPIDVTLALVLPLMHALAMAHDRGVIHRDLKPDNVFLARNAHGRIVPKLLDFGIAKVMPKDGSTSSTLSTRAGSAIGTPAYMSPEQARGTADVGTTTDVWAIGVILFECIAGRIPFEAETGSILMARIIMEQAPSLASVAPETPAAIVAAIDRALAAKSEARWPSMAAFATALREAARESDVALPPAGASDAAPMSMPPPRREVPPDAGLPQISTGDSDEALHPATRARREAGPRSPTSAATQPRLHAREVSPAQARVGPATTLPELGSPAAEPLARPSTSSIPMIPVVAVSLVLAALVVLGLWMREPDEASLPEVPEPIAAAAPTESAAAAAPDPAPSVDEPETVAPPEAPVVEVVAPDPPVAVTARERRGRVAPRETSQPTPPPAGPAPRSGSSDGRLPELTEW